MTRDEWISAFAAAAGVEPPESDTIDVLLDAAGIAAHASERTAAPITCWLAGIAGIDTDRALAIAREIEDSHN